MNPTQVTTAQSNLTARGICGGVDGAWGAKTCAGLMAAMVGKKAVSALMLDLAVAVIKYSGLADLTTPLRVSHFLAQAAVETDRWRTLVEYGSDAYFAKYGVPPISKSLGNIIPADGPRFRGRGLLQTTGRANYSDAAKVTGLDLLGHPESLAEPDTGTFAAASYWAKRGINAKADADDIDGVTRAINGGLNALTDRKAFLAAAKTVWGL